MSNTPTPSPWHHIAAKAAMVLAILQALLILVSWIVSSAMPGLGVRSLLASEGIRWFFDHFQDHLSSPLLAWLILLPIGIGSYCHSGLHKTLCALVRGKSLTLRQRYGLAIVFIELLLFLLVMVLLTCVGHGLLLSGTGQLFPSPFSRSVVPALAFIATMGALTYGVLSRRITTLSSAMDILTRGFIPMLPLYVVYIVATQLWHSLRYVCDF